MSLFNTNVMHISLFVTFLMIVYLYIAGAYFICLLHILIVENISSNRTLDLHSSFMKEKVCCKNMTYSMEMCMIMFKGENAIFFYNLLLSKMFFKPHLEKKKWCEFTPIESDMVKMIYSQKVINIKDKSVAEFYYKLLNNLLNCNKQLSK